MYIIEIKVCWKVPKVTKPRLKTYAHFSILRIIDLPKRSYTKPPFSKLHSKDSHRRSELIIWRTCYIYKSSFTICNITLVKFWFNSWTHCVDVNIRYLWAVVENWSNHHTIERVPALVRSQSEVSSPSHCVGEAGLLLSCLLGPWIRLLVYISSINW